MRITSVCFVLVSLVAVSLAGEKQGADRPLNGVRVQSPTLAFKEKVGQGESKPETASQRKLPLKSATKPEEVDGKAFDLVVIGGTPGGIACAVRASREGLRVLLVNHNEHLGGILSSGLRVWDTLYEGKRSPIYDEVRQAIFDYYLRTYGKDSPQYRRCLPGESGHTNGQFEPHVAEKILTQLVEREAGITLLVGYIPQQVKRDERLLREAVFRELEGEHSVVVRATVFADCSYEGDFLALAKVPYRVGREARSEFDEPHAGVIFMRRVPVPDTAEAKRLVELHDQLDLRKFSGWEEIVQPDSTGEAHPNVQAVNVRTILSSNPANQLPTKRPADYDAEQIRKLVGRTVIPIPNQKFGWNRPQLVGPHQAYVEGDWNDRQAVMDAHWQATLAVLYFLQNDPSVDRDTQEFWKTLGVAKDEFVDNDNIPYEIYLREARRLVGRYVFTEHDATLASAHSRAPIHSDSVGITEWFMDSHACSDRVAEGGSLPEGKMTLHHETFPGQVPYRCLLSPEVDNLLVPVCLSATHVAWGTIRLEPTWMNIAESAAYAAAMAVELKQTPAELNSDALVRLLAEKRVMVSFFNHLDISADEDWIAAAQYFGTKGFFPDYTADPATSILEAEAKIWAEGFRQLRDGALKADQLASKVQESRRASGAAISRRQFAKLIGATTDSQAQLTRKSALLLMWKQLKENPHE